jgi:hypothetical protein
MKRHAFPCCRYLTILDALSGPPGTFYICPVCGWEDDNVQHDDPDYRGGANIGSLNEYRAAFEDWRDAGMPADPRRRPPLPDEQLALSVPNSLCSYADAGMDDKAKRIVIESTFPGWAQEGRSQRLPRGGAGTAQSAPTAV